MAATVKKSLRLLILGATGGIGQELVDQALERKHHLTAFVRTPQKLGPSGEGLAVIQGNLLAADAVVDALECRDAVLPAIGPPGLGRSTITGDAAQATVTAMKATGTRRTVIVGVGMLFADSVLLCRVFRTIFMRNLAKDSAEMEGIVNTSELDWTIVRPPRLTKGPRTERYRVADDHWPRGAGEAATISGGGRCRPLLGDEVERSGRLQRVVGIAYT
jgi:putative NADH-flavin reductase